MHQLSYFTFSSPILSYIDLISIILYRIICHRISPYFNIYHDDHRAVVNSFANSHKNFNFIFLIILTFLRHFSTLFVLWGEDVAADNLMRTLKVRGVEVELRQERKSRISSSNILRAAGTYATFAQLYSTHWLPLCTFICCNLMRCGVV